MTETDAAQFPCAFCQEELPQTGMIWGAGGSICPNCIMICAVAAAERNSKLGEALIEELLKIRAGQIPGQLK